METRHTPGPWEIDVETRPVEICTIHHCPTQPTEDGKGQSWINIRGAVGYWDADENEQMANAKLIAAAPDLYEALCDMVSDRHDLNDATCEFAEKALAKARGEQQ